MPKHFEGETKEGQSLANWPAIYQEAAKHKRFGVVVLSEAEYITHRQIAWWKGILLPALAKDSGDSAGYWETRLKLAVLPDDFDPYYVALGKQVFPIIPSITKLSKKKMNVLIEGSVDKCHDWGFDWVTLPNEDLRVIK